MKSRESIDIQQQLTDLLDTVTSACRNLLQESGRYTKTFEKARYACAILRPSKRMSAAIGADRELLLVSTNFENQQQRTIRFITKEIKESEGRLENTLAFAVHLDRDGDSKLRTWGREVGVTIIPFNGNTKIDSEEEFERRLATQLYAHDPFDVSAPVSSDASFYGRRQEAIDLARKLQHGQIRSCLGIRKIGKTSIVNRVLMEIRRAYSNICIMIDCSRDDVFELGATGLLYSIGMSIQQAQGEESTYCKLKPTQTKKSLAHTRETLAQILGSSGSPVVIVFDEVDYITPGSPTAKHWQTEFNLFWRNLRTIYQECQREDIVLSILVAGVSTHWFTVGEVVGIENAALAFIPEEYVSPMPTGASVAMLRRLGRTAGLVLSEEAAQYISQVTSNMPFWARKFASYIHRKSEIDGRPFDVDIKSAQSLGAAFVEEEGTAIAEVALNHLYRVHPDVARAMKALHDTGIMGVKTSQRMLLHRYGIIDQDGNFSGLMIERAYKSLTSQMSQERGAVEIASLEEWAEDISAVSRRRNLVERKLRGIVLNFLRMDALSSGELSGLKDRITEGLSDHRRVKLGSMPLESVMEELTWKQLVQVISSHWPIFEKIFGERNTFLQNCDVVNDRPDAHAKSFDQADFALYRRSLGQIESALSRLG